MTLTGPADVWFGFDFDAQAMRELPYTIIVSGEDVWEETLGNHAAGKIIPTSITV